MPTISNKKREKISEQMLLYLYTIFPKLAYTSEIAAEVARDEEFAKTLLEELEKKELVLAIKKNQQGKLFIRRIRWRLSNKAYQAYKERQ